MGTSGAKNDGTKAGATPRTNAAKSGRRTAVRSRSTPAQVIDGDAPVAPAQEIKREREQALAVTENNLTALREKLTKLEKNAVERTKGLRNELADRNTALVEANSRAEHAETQWAAVQAELATRNAELKEVTNRAASFSGELQRSKEEAGAMAQPQFAKLASLQNELVERDAALVESNNRAERAKAELASAQAELKEVINRVGSFPGELQRAAAMIKGLSEKLTSMQNELAKRDAALVAANDRAERAEAQLTPVRGKRPTPEILTVRFTK